MNKLFIDTSAWIAAADSDETKHSEVCVAKDQWLANQGILVTLIMLSMKHLP